MHQFLPASSIYKKNRNKQLAFENFNQPLGLHLNPENRWIKKAKTIPWDAIEDRCAELFPSNRGVPAKPLRMALGSLIIQKQIGCSEMAAVRIYRNRKNLSYCKLHGIRLSGPSVSLVLSIIAMNVGRLTRLSVMRFLLSIFQGANVGLNLEPAF